MSNKSGNPGALAAWRKNHTPEELQKIYHAAAQKRLLRRQQQAITNGASDRVVAFTIQERRNGKHVPGQSRTISIQGCPIPIDEMQDWLEAQIRVLRSRGTAVEKPKTSKLLTW